MTAVGLVTKQLSVKISHDGGALTEYNTAVLGVKEVPSFTVQTQAMASGETAQDVGPASWALEISYHAVWNAASLHRILVDNHGETGTLEWQPDPVGTPALKRTATVRLVAPSGDATVGNFQTGTISLPVIGTITSVDA